MTKPIYRQKATLIGIAVTILGFFTGPAVLPLVPVAWAPFILMLAGVAGVINSVFLTKRAEEPLPVAVPGA